MDDRFDRFETLASVKWAEHIFTTRGCTARAMRHADDGALLASLPIVGREWRFAEQVHGDGVAVVGTGSARVSPGVDALCTREAGVVLGVSVADCCAAFVVDVVRRAIGLAHSGRRGSELNVLGALVEAMGRSFGTEPKDLLIQLSPCIRPPQYEVDFAAQIRGQAQSMGIVALHDCGVCTASRIDRYYSYRAEKGIKGRMLAAIGIL